ncbi:hypothetical protein PROFUN_09520 [Planoprotostelium fungivorum]|uniref:MYND-type domain-containing protein n=1 Tax=Planoprotostelium fungivorum TaxID=1890364 RepID=A0A2P6N8B7_9EUKA|nr:hypothetical protein PROFUN_12150 [Planoprotostelium fungivorum]PRP83308.1 hypothetical protein PROFUN_09520 [Planoprotostelium fungivorum]
MAYYGPWTFTPGSPAEKIVQLASQNGITPKRLDRGQLSRLLLLDPEGFVDRFGDVFRVFLHEKNDLLEALYDGPRKELERNIRRFWVNVFSQKNIDQIFLAFWMGIARALKDDFYRSKLGQNHITLLGHKFATLGDLDKSRPILSQEDRTRLLPWVDTLSNRDYLHFEMMLGGMADLIGSDFLSYWMNEQHVQQTETWLIWEKRINMAIKRNEKSVQERLQRIVADEEAFVATSEEKEGEWKKKTPPGSYVEVMTRYPVKGSWPADGQVVKECALCYVIENLSLCQGCRKVHYCGREHQQADWHGHKAMCKREQKNQSK